ncbi:MAG: glycosyltransferase family protein [Sumerlaeia bacterium]
MGKIFFSMSGEGRGHATRVRSMVEALRHRHEITLLCPGDAFELLAPIYRNTNVRITRIPGLRFSYKPNKKLDFIATARGAIAFIFKLPKRVRKMARLLQREQPNVIVTDFEPLLPRAAKRCGIPFLSVNHQHFLIVNDLSQLNWKLRFSAWYMSLVVRVYYWGQAQTVISQFYFPPVRPEFKGKVTMAGVLMRPEILAAKPKIGDFLLVYLRKFASPELLQTLQTCGKPVRIYGLGEKPAEGQIEYCQINDHQFQHDLSNCLALITTAGNQLVGEALYLRKPVLAMPEANNHEQYINAYYLQQSGGGMWCELDSLTPTVLEKFLQNVPRYRAQIDPDRMNGNDIVVRAIEEYAG